MDHYLRTNELDWKLVLVLSLITRVPLQCTGVYGYNKKIYYFLLTGKVMIFTSVVKFFAGQ